MEKHIYNEQTGISYTLHGDYYLPDFALSDEEKDVEIGVWGQRHLRYIKQHRKVLYLNLLTSGKLNGYLSDIDKQAEDMLSRLVKQIRFACAPYAIPLKIKLVRPPYGGIKICVLRTLIAPTALSG